MPEMSRLTIRSRISRLSFEEPNFVPIKYGFWSIKVFFGCFGFVCICFWISKLVIGYYSSSIFLIERQSEKYAKLFLKYLFII